MKGSRIAGCGPYTAPERRVVDADGVRRALLDFFDREARDLPWRRTSDPYRIWVSEIMLQQTRVDTVREYYARWMERFPDVQSLATADLDDVLAEWKGLGYYARARNLHRAASIVREQHGGRFPADPAAVRELPGIGDYTAGAIGSIAFGRAEPAVDGNVRRVLSRLFDIERPTTGKLRELARHLVDHARPGDFNQALMELGATVCTPRNPACDVCPVTRWCEALARGTVSERPPSKKRRAVPRVHRLTLVAVLHRDRTVIRRRPAHGLLGGLWEFPSTEWTSDATHGADLVHLPPVAHRFSHLHATYHPVLVPVSGFPDRLAAGPVDIELAGDATRLLRWAELDAVALPVAQQKIAALAAAAV